MNEQTEPTLEQVPPPRQGLSRFLKPLAMMGGGIFIFGFFALVQPIGLLGGILAVWGLIKAIKVF